MASERPTCEVVYFVVSRFSCILTCDMDKGLRRATRNDVRRQADKNNNGVQNLKQEEKTKKQLRNLM